MADCETCGLREQERAALGCETFTLVMHDPESSLTWDVDRARQILKLRPRAPRYLPPEGQRPFLFQAGEVDEGHLPHIPEAALREPGIAVVLDNFQPDGTRAVLLVQIDGSHRAELARRNQHEPLLYLLTEEEQQACVLMYLADGVPQAVPQIMGPAPTV